MFSEFCLPGLRAFFPIETRLRDNCSIETLRSVSRKYPDWTAKVSAPAGATPAHRGKRTGLRQRGGDGCSGRAAAARCVAARRFSRTAENNTQENQRQQLTRTRDAFHNGNGRRFSRIETHEYTDKHTILSNDSGNGKRRQTRAKGRQEVVARFFATVNIIVVTTHPSVHHLHNRTGQRFCF